MTSQKTTPAERYRRQELFEPLGLAGQEKLSAAKALIVGVGGLGSWLGELLARAGVGTLRLVDDDVVDWTNLARQAMYDETDAKNATRKVHAARSQLARINSSVKIEALPEKVTAANIAELASDVDIILDGTDDWATRFVINDYAVRAGRPWIFAGVVQAEGQVMPYLPGRTACLRCIFESPPPAETEKSCKASVRGVLGPAVAAIAAIEAVEAIKILAGKADDVNMHLTKLELWTGRHRRINSDRPNPHCPCCSGRKFEFLQQ